MVNKLTNYIKASRIELKKVSWLSKEEVKKHTQVVILISLGVALFLGIFDWAFSSLLALVIR